MPSTDIDARKVELRARAKANRNAAVSAAGPDAATHFAENLMSIAGSLALDETSVIAGYWAMSNELDVTPAMLALSASCGARCALPVVIKNNAPLVFRNWAAGMELDSGGFGTQHPPESAGVCVPDILIVPLLAFDGAGYRLGWGGGFYDRTLEQLRDAGRTVVAVGAAYAGQELDEVVRGPYDQPLEWIVTEQSARRIDDTDTVKED